MNLLDAKWSDENIRFQNRQNDFYLTEAGYRLKKNYLKSLEKLNTHEEESLLSCLHEVEDRRSFIDSDLFGGCLDHECQCLCDSLLQRPEELLEEESVLKCIHNSMIRRHRTPTTNFSEPIVLQTPTTNSNYNVFNNSNNKIERENFQNFFKQPPILQNNHVPAQRHKLNAQHCASEMVNMRSNMSNNHNADAYNDDHLNSFFSLHPYSQHPTFTTNCVNLSYEPQEAGFVCPCSNSYPTKNFQPQKQKKPDPCSVEESAKRGTIFNNLSFLLSRFKSRYLDDDQQPSNGNSKEILKYLYSSFLDQVNCDFIVKTKNGDVMCHQMVIAAFSPSVDSYLKSQKKKLQQPLMVNLEDCSLEAVSNVLNFLYTTDITINSLNIGFIANVSMRLDLPILNHVSNDYLIQTLDTENAFLHLSVSINNKFLAAVHIFKFIALNFFDLIEHEHMLLLPFENFFTLVTHPSLRAKELELFMSIANWINFNRPSRMKHAKSLLSLVKFHSIDPNQLAKYVEHQDWLFRDDFNKKIILDAYKYHALNKTRDEPTKYE